MFDLNATDGSVRKIAYESPIPGGGDAEAKELPADKLDQAEAVELHHRLLNHYTRELDKQFENRRLMAIDEDVYDNYQWDEADAKVVEDRGQKAMVYNVISASIDWVTGTEKRARTDFNILPRRKEDGKPAQRKTELLKYLSDVNRTPFHVSRAFEDGVKAGLGWMEDAIADGDEDEPLYSRYENWRNILWDSNATEMDLKDARYIFRAKWYDEDIAMAMFPKRRGTIESACSAADDFISLDAYSDEVMDSQEIELEGAQRTTSDRVTGYQRRRCRLIEGWIRLPVDTQRIKGGPFHGDLYDKFSRGHHDSLQAGEARIVNRVSLRMHVAIFTTTGMVWLSESPYRHNQFPFTPIWGKRRKRNGLPYGMVRGLKDIQDDINKRASKALWLMSTNGVIMDEGAVDDVDELAEEVARPDYIIVKKTGKELKIERGAELSQYQLELMSRSISMIQQASGVTDELLGRETGAKSGIAIQRRQDQGSLASALYFENLRFSQQLRGEKLLSNVEQFMGEEKAFRITNQRGKPEYVTVNDGLPENDIVRSKADFVISDQDWKATMRQAAVDQLLELMQKLPPQVGLIVLDLVVENMDISNRDELVKRIRGMTGQRDPDADELTPEEQQQIQAKQEADAINKQTVLANLKKTLADAAKSEAQAELLAGQLVGTNVTSQTGALTAAHTAFSVPAPVVHAADHILEGAGYKSLSPIPTPPAGPIPPGMRAVGLGGAPPMGMPPPQALPAPAPAFAQ